MNPSKLALPFFTALLLSPTSGCRRPHEPLETIRQQIQNEIALRAPSISMAVAQGNHIVWEEAFGWADREHQIRATPETMYTIGSLAKPITATAIMLLRDRGLINLDRPVNDYLGERQLVARIGNTSEATVRRVAQHTAGLPGYYESFYPDESGQPPTIDEVIRRYGILVFRPGERFHYSNLDYAVLGDVISRTSGKDYGDFVRDEVFLPLGMNHSCVITCQGLAKYRATRYLRVGSPLPDYTTPHPAASDVYASAHDLIGFAMFHMKIRPADQKQILSDDAIDEMQTRTVQMGDSSYGIGWVITQDAKGHRRLGHGGAGAGVDAQLTFVPENKLAVAVLVNTYDDGHPHIAGKIADGILDTFLADGRTSRWRAMLDAIMARLQKRSGIPATLGGKWMGAVHTYERDLPVTMWFNQSGGVEAQLDNQPKTSINNSRLQNGMFTGTFSGEIGTPDANRRRYGLEWDVVLRRDVLNGVLYAVGNPDSRGLLLGYWTELRRSR